MSNLSEVTILIYIEKIFLPKIFLVFEKLKEKSGFSNNLISILRSISCIVCINKTSWCIVVTIVSQFRICKICTKCPQLIIVSRIDPFFVLILLEELLPSTKYILCCIHRKKVLIFLINKRMLMNSGFFEFNHNLLITQKNQLKKRIFPFLYKLAMSFSCYETVLKTLIPLMFNSTIRRNRSYLPSSRHSLGWMET
jgi:hypothetical protein